MKLTHFAAAAALVATSGAAAAQNATDARCVLLTNAFAGETKDANAQKLAEASFYFYLGRMGAQATATQLKTLFDQQGKTVTDATAGGIMNDCVKEFRAKVQMIQSLGTPPPQPPTKK